MSVYLLCNLARRRAHVECWRRGAQLAGQRNGCGLHRGVRTMQNRRVMLVWRSHTHLQTNVSHSDRPLITVYTKDSLIMKTRELADLVLFIHTPPTRICTHGRHTHGTTHRDNFSENFYDSRSCTFHFCCPCPDCILIQR